jgi:hypothetical protein
MRGCAKYNDLSRGQALEPHTTFLFIVGGEASG